MGVAQNSLLGAGAAVGIAANKLAVGLSSKSDSKDMKNQNIAQATSAEKAEMAQITAKLQAEKLKNLKLKLKQQQLKNKDLRAKNRQMRQKQTLKKEDKPNG